MARASSSGTGSGSRAACPSASTSPTTSSRWACAPTPRGLAAVAAGAALARRLEAAGGAAGTAAAVLDLYLLDIWLRYASDAAGNGPLAGRCAAIADYLERKPSP